MGSAKLWLDIRYPALPDIRPDIRQCNPVSGSDTGYQKRPEYPAGYPLHPL
jgi:hypothetical protein